MKRHLIFLMLIGISWTFLGGCTSKPQTITQEEKAKQEQATDKKATSGNVNVKDDKGWSFHKLDTNK